MPKNEDRPKVTVSHIVYLDGHDLASITQEFQEVAVKLGAPVDELRFDVEPDYDNSYTQYILWDRPMNDTEWSQELQRRADHEANARKREEQLAEDLKRRRPDLFPPVFEESP